MTIGVVDECRRLGLGTQLLNRAIKLINQQWPACEVLYLHVVEYNESAIRFYLNPRNKFVKHSVLHEHYFIINQNYNALLLYRDISGGHGSTESDDVLGYPGSL
jgi:ribosomal protein S18 acetylase RimI-like enzyme